MPRSRKTPAQLATEAGELVRSLNHATLERGAFAYPGDVDETVQALAILAGYLPQAISQAHAALAAMGSAGTVRLDAWAGDPSVERHLAGAEWAAADATGAAAGLMESLRKLGSLTARIGFAEPQAAGA